MSTTFGAKIKRKKVEVALRHCKGGWGAFFEWKSETASLLPDNTSVFPMDNTAQGITTIGDIRKAINAQNAAGVFKDTKVNG